MDTGISHMLEQHGYQEGSPKRSGKGKEVGHKESYGKA